MKRVFNFSAGPAMLPEQVLERARDEILDWHDTGMSIMEVSHRGKLFASVAEQSEQDLRDLLNIPDSYAVLFMQGGATLQFSLIPMNLSAGKPAEYIQTGAWSKKAIAAARKICPVEVVADTSATGFDRAPAQSTWNRAPESAFLHYCMNETIHGVEFPFVPEETDCPLVVDCSSNILSAPLQIERFGLVYAGSQKNIGPAGLTLVIVRKDLLARCPESLPDVLNYRLTAESGSMLNTPPTYSWYLAGLVFQWLKTQGGLEEMQRRNRRKAEKLYRAIDESAFYANPVRPDSRSLMNIPFTLANSELDGEFLRQAEQAGLTNLKGHRSVGGMRASIYNAMPEEGIDALVSFMADFEAHST
jgi:phosphoserine aminotransferase